MTEEDFGIFFDIGDDGYASILEDQVESLQKKLEIAVKALEEIERKSDKFDGSWSIQEQLDWIKAECQSTLYCLKETEGVK